MSIELILNLKNNRDVVRHFGHSRLNKLNAEEQDAIYESEHLNVCDKCKHIFNSEYEMYWCGEVPNKLDQTDLDAVCDECYEQINENEIELFGNTIIIA
tara:strand:- start:890 stop:1186 length:297 start_codon:yes stop_codon:yes gene_type:complete